MRQIWITRTGPPEVLEMREAPDPEPQQGQVRIRVAAAGVNFADVLARLGLYADAPPLPTVVGFEVAGRVDSVGEGVSAEWIGKDVLALTRFGGYSDLVCADLYNVFERPAGMSAEVGSALPVTYLTAYLALVVMGALKEGERVLIHSAAGGLGLAAIDLCGIYGAQIYGTASASKHEFLRDRGVSDPIDYRNIDFGEEITRLTVGRGVHIVLDPLGGDSWRQSYRSLAPTGRLLLLGVANAAPSKEPRLLSVIRALLRVPWLQFNPLKLMKDSRAVVGVHLGHLGAEEERARDWMREILDWHRAGKIDPHVDRTFPFEEAAAAHHYIQDRKNIGKVVLVP